MKHKKQVKIPEKTETRIVRVTCDLCGNDIKSNRHDAEEVSIKHRTGNNCPEGGSGNETSVDMCGKCFDEKLIPWLMDQGAKPCIEEWDW